MSSSQIMDVFYQAMIAAVKIGAPILIISMAIGLVISIFQAATQIHEQTLTFVPKLLAIAIILLLCGSWMMNVMSDFFVYILDTVVNLG